VVRAHATDLQNVEVGSADVLTDVDTPDDYEEVFGKLR
jgi:CTP:molybdopterin cytidylyltransferase MocA